MEYVLRGSTVHVRTGTRIQCGGTLSPLPSGRDLIGISGDVQWKGLTVFLGVGPGRTVDSLLTSELAAGLYGCAAGLRNKSGDGSYSVLGIWHDTLPAAGSASRSVSIPVAVLRMKYHGTIV